jgi:hypothetical protein
VTVLEVYIGVIKGNAEADSKYNRVSDSRIRPTMGHVQ